MICESVELIGEKISLTQAIIIAGVGGILLDGFPALNLVLDYQECGRHDSLIF